MEEDLQSLGEELITTAARIVRWAPKDAEGFTISLAAARLLARLQDNGPTRISDLATLERCSQPTITNHIKRWRPPAWSTARPIPRDAPGLDDQADREGRRELAEIRSVARAASLEPYLAAIG